MATDDVLMQNVVRFRMLPQGKVQQRHADQTSTEFDPANWATYSAGEKTVQAVRIPRAFMVGADFCRDGWLVVEGHRLYAVSDRTFTKDFQQTLLGAA